MAVTHMKGLAARWIDGGYEPSERPDPNYPLGMDVDLSRGSSARCKIALRYPAPRCGMYLLTCDICGFRGIVTAAGRIDDPRSITVACNRAS